MEEQQFEKSEENIMLDDLEQNRQEVEGFSSELMKIVVQNLRESKNDIMKGISSIQQDLQVWGGGIEKSFKDHLDSDEENIEFDENLLNLKHELYKQHQQSNMNLQLENIERGNENENKNFDLEERLKSEAEVILMIDDQLRQTNKQFYQQKTKKQQSNKNLEKQNVPTKNKIYSQRFSMNLPNEKPKAERKKSKINLIKFEEQKNQFNQEKISQQNNFSRNNTSTSQNKRNHISKSIAIYQNVKKPDTGYKNTNKSNVSQEQDVSFLKIVPQIKTPQKTDLNDKQKKNPEKNFNNILPQNLENHSNQKQNNKFNQQVKNSQIINQNYQDKNLSKYNYLIEDQKKLNHSPEILIKNELNFGEQQEKLSKMKIIQIEENENIFENSYQNQNDNKFFLNEISNRQILTVQNENLEFSPKKEKGELEQDIDYQQQEIQEQNQINIDIKLDDIKSSVEIEQNEKLSQKNKIEKGYLNVNQEENFNQNLEQIEEQFQLECSNEFSPQKYDIIQYEKDQDFETLDEIPEEIDQVFQQDHPLIQKQQKLQKMVRRCTSQMEQNRIYDQEQGKIQKTEQNENQIAFEDSVSLRIDQNLAFNKYKNENILSEKEKIFDRESQSTENQSDQGIQSENLIEQQKVSFNKNTQRSSSVVDQYPKQEVKIEKEGEPSQKENIIKQGYLMKDSKSIFTRFQNRYFILSETKLTYFKEKNQIQNRGCINFKLTQCEIQTQPNFLIIIAIKDYNEEWRLKASNKNEQEEWFKCIKFIIVNNQSVAKILIKTQNLELYFEKDIISERELVKYAETGDILLFVTDNIAAKLQRKITGSNYDHVGMCLKFDNNDLRVFDSQVGVGVSVSDWAQFIYYNNLYQQVAIRKLCHPNKENIKPKIFEFVGETIGCKYQLTFGKLMKRNSLKRSEQEQQQYKQKSGVSKNEQEGYFCSELVAKALKRANLLPQTKSSSCYWPVSFSEEKDLQLLNGAYLANEKIVLLDRHQKLDETAFDTYKF